MATNYPAAIDALTNPTPTDTQDTPSHSSQHADANDAIEAVETELGVNPRGADASVRARLDRFDIHDLDQKALTDDQAAALGTWEVWGVETIVFAAPGQAVKVAGWLTGSIIYNNATASRRIGYIRAQISLDGGATWASGVENRGELRGDDVRRDGLAAHVFASGTPTGNIVIRAQLQQNALGVAGDLVFQQGSLLAEVIGA